MSKKGAYGISTVKAMQMIAPTFGIALMTGPGEPLPALTRTGAIALWEKSMPADEKKETHGSKSK